MRGGWQGGREGDWERGRKEEETGRQSGKEGEGGKAGEWQTRMQEGRKREREGWRARQRQLGRQEGRGERKPGKEKVRE